MLELFCFGWVCSFQSTDIGTRDQSHYCFLFNWLYRLSDPWVYKNCPCKTVEQNLTPPVIYKIRLCVCSVGCFWNLFYLSRCLCPRARRFIALYKSMEVNKEAPSGFEPGTAFAELRLATRPRCQIQWQK